MSYTESTVLGIVKARLNRLASDTSLDEYLMARIEATDREMAGNGINLVADDTRDAVLLADMVVWRHLNRDQSNSQSGGGGMPEWLMLARRERWLRERNKDDSG